MPWFVRTACLIAVLLGACDGGSMGGSMMGARIPPIPGGTLPDADSPGARLVARYCGQCHRVPAPGSHAGGGWPAVVRRMDGYMRRHGGGAMMMMRRVDRPTDRERGMIIAYLQAHAQRALDKSAYRKALATPGGREFQRICGRCHVLPAPGQHTRGEWPAVVHRMVLHMRDRGMPATDAAAVRGVIAFLQRSAG